MTDPEHRRLARLAELAGLVRDARLADLSRHVQAMAETRDRLSALSVPMPADPDLPLHRIELAALQHDRWAAPRRMMLNERLALQAAARIEAESKARAAFGRALVLGRLVEGKG